MTNSFLTRTRDQILPLYVPIGASNDLISPDVVSALIPHSLVQDVPMFLIALRQEVIDLIAHRPLNSVLRLQAALILRSLVKLTL